MYFTVKLKKNQQKNLILNETAEKDQILDWRWEEVRILKRLVWFQRVTYFQYTNKGQSLLFNI